MKIVKLFILTFAMLILCCAAAMAQTPGQTIESFLERLTFAKSGNGEQTVFVICNPECARCEKFSSMVDALPPDQAAAFEFRWVMRRDNSPELLYVMESGGVSEMYKNKQPKPVANEDNLSIGLAYNDIILGQIFRHLLMPSRTPVIIIKKQGVFRTVSLENIDGKIYETLHGSEHVAAKPTVSIINEVFESFNEIPKPIVFPMAPGASFRLLPVDDSPCINVPDKFDIVPIMKKDDWYGVDFGIWAMDGLNGKTHDWHGAEFNMPPFLFIKKSDLGAPK